MDFERILPPGWRPTSLAFKRMFLGEDGHPNRDGELVLGKLAKFCRGNRSSIAVSPVTGMIDPIAVGVAEGRREVLLMVLRHLNLDEHDVAVAVHAHDRAETGPSDPF